MTENPYPLDQPAARYWSEGYTAAKFDLVQSQIRVAALERFHDEDQGRIDWLEQEVTRLKVVRSPQFIQAPPEDPELDWGALTSVGSKLASEPRPSSSTPPRRLKQQC